MTAVAGGLDLTPSVCGRFTALEVEVSSKVNQAVNVIGDRPLQRTQPLLEVAPGPDRVSALRPDRRPASLSTCGYLGDGRAAARAG